MLVLIFTLPVLESKLERLLVHFFRQDAGASLLLHDIYWVIEVNLFKRLLRIADATSSFAIILLLRYVLNITSGVISCPDHITGVKDHIGSKCGLLARLVVILGVMRVHVRQLIQICRRRKVNFVFRQILSDLVCVT